jgi:hypothetical protein
MERIEVLRQRIAELVEQVAVQEDVLSRLGITRETMMQLLAVTDVSPDPVSSLDPVSSPDPVLGVVSQPSADAGEHPVVAVVANGARVKVPVWREGTDAAVLPLVYRDIVEVLVDFGRPVRVKTVATGLGLAQEAASIEGLRAKLKRLVARGWVSEPAPGLFTGNGGPSAADDDPGL